MMFHMTDLAQAVQVVALVGAAVSAAGLFVRAGRVLAEVERLARAVTELEKDVHALGAMAARLDERTERTTA